MATSEQFSGLTYDAMWNTWGKMKWKNVQPNLTKNQHQGDKIFVWRNDDK